MRHETRPDAILIAGPTASGKSALAVKLAARLGGVVINADSMQVYQDLRVLTARPDDTDEKLVPHALYGMIDGAVAYSVSLWLADALGALDRAAAAGSIAIFTGGTGLYFKGLTQGLSEIPAVPLAIRTELRAWAAGRAPQILHDELRRRDPATAARIRPTDPQRLLRALEVHTATGESLSAFQSRRGPAPLAGLRVEAYVLDVDRDILRDRIDRRLHMMVESGALAEVARLRTRRLAPDLPVMRAVGVPQLLRHLKGEIDITTAIEEAKSATRSYLRRQTTFFRHQLPSFESIEPERLDVRQFV